MNRRTEYVSGYGHVTTGDGLFDTIVSGIKDLVSSKAVRDAGGEALKAAAKSGGDKLGTKVVERVFKDKSSNKNEVKPPEIVFGYDPVSAPKVNKKTTSVKSNKKPTNDLLKDIYGDSLFKRQKGRGLKRI